MSYVLTNGATGVVTYPYSIGLLRRDNPNVSFPAQPTDEFLADWNVYPVTNVTPPAFDRLTQDLTEVNPTSSDGVTWTQEWLVTNVDQATADARTAQAQAEAAAEAGRLLQESEQYYIDAMIAGYGFTADMTQYVDDLENYSGIIGFPKIEEMQWPVFPATILDPANPDLPVSIYTKTQADEIFVTHLELESTLADYATNAAIGDYVGQFNDAIALKADLDYVDNNFVPQAGFTDSVLSIAGGAFLPLSGGQMTGPIDMVQSSIVGLPDPTADDHATNKIYVDSEISNAISTVAVNPRLTITLETDTGSITTQPKIADALSTIGTTNGYTINLGFGEYRETGPIVVNEKWQLQINGNRTAGTTSATIKNGLTIQNSNGVRLHTVQVEGATSISSRAGLGLYSTQCQFMGNVTLGGTGGFMIFTDCDFGGNVTISPTFAGVVYFVRCAFSKADGVYTFSQSSALQAIISDSSGIPNTPMAKASYSGSIILKNNTQSLYLNGVPIKPAGATNGQVLQLVTGTSNEWVPRTITVPGWGVIAQETTAGAKTIATTWNQVKATYKEIQIAAICSDNHIAVVTLNTALINTGRAVHAHHVAHGSDDDLLIAFGDVNTANYTATFSGTVSTFFIYAR